MRLNAQTGQRICELRERRKLTRSELAEQIGVSRDYLYRIESGIVTASPEALGRLAVALGVDDLNALLPLPPAEDGRRERIAQSIGAWAEVVREARECFPAAAREQSDREVYDQCLKAWQESPDYEIGNMQGYVAWLIRRDVRCARALLQAYQSLCDAAEGAE